MYCYKCGAKNDDRAKFCEKCGVSLQQEVTEAMHVEQGMASGDKKTTQKKKGMFAIIVPMLAFFVLLGIGGILVYKHFFTYQYLACVQNDKGKYGFVNDKGEEVIACTYDNAKSFSKNGLGLVGEENGTDADGDSLYRWGAINAKGELVVPFQYDNVERAEDSSYNVENSTGDSYIAVAKARGVDQEGDIVYSWGFIDASGKEVISCKYQTSIVQWLKNGKYIVGKKVGTDDRGNDIIRDGVIDKNDKVVIPFEYAGLRGDFSEHNNLMWAYKTVGYDENGEEITKMGYINKNNEEIIPFKYDLAGSFSPDGLAYVAMKQDEVDENGFSVWKYGYINEEGKKVIPLQYSYADEFAENGLAYVASEDISGYIDENGNMKIEAVGGDTFRSNNLATACMGKRDADGNVRYGVIDSSGNIIIPDEYYRTVVCQNSNNLVEIIDKIAKEGEDDYILKYGVANSKGDILVEPTYTSMETTVGDNRWIVAGISVGDEEIEKYQYIDEEGKVTLELSDQYTNAENFVKVK